MDVEHQIQQESIRLAYQEGRVWRMTLAVLSATTLAFSVPILGQARGIADPYAIMLLKASWLSFIVCILTTMLSLYLENLAYLEATAVEVVGQTDRAIAMEARELRTQQLVPLTWYWEWKILAEWQGGHYKELLAQYPEGARQLAEARKNELLLPQSFGNPKGKRIYRMLVRKRGWIGSCSTLLFIVGYILLALYFFYPEGVPKPSLTP